MACFSATLGQLPYACISTHTEAGRVQWPDSEPKNTSSCRMLVKPPWGWMFVLVCAYVHVKALHVMQNNTKKQGAVIAVYKIWSTTAVTVRELLGCYLTIKSESNRNLGWLCDFSCNLCDCCAVWFFFFSKFFFLETSLPIYEMVVEPYFFSKKSCFFFLNYVQLRN